MSVSLLNSYVEVLTPKRSVTILVDGVSGRCLNHGVAILMNGFSALIKEVPEKNL